jgi:hypothetical protein
MDPRYAAHLELMQVEQNLRFIQAERPRIFWPVAMVSAGGGALLIGTLSAVAIWQSSRDRRYGWDEEGNRYQYTHVEPNTRDEVIGPIVFAALGAGVLAGGLALLIPRVRVRRQLAPELRRLQQRRRELLGWARYNLSFDATRAGLSARVNF